MTKLAWRRRILSGAVRAFVRPGVLRQQRARAFFYVFGVITNAPKGAAGYVG
jgi:hypothetical protein